MGAFFVRTNEISNGQTLCKHILKSLGKKSCSKSSPLLREKFDVDLCKKKWPGKPQIFACNSENLSDIKKNIDVGIESADISSSI